jgi:uncharacterized protein
MSALVILGNSLPPAAAAAAHAITPPWLHLLNGNPPLVFMVNGSRLFEVEPGFFAELGLGSEQAHAELSELAKAWPQAPDNVPLQSPNAITLNVAQSCNLSCAYCYADEGRFGSRAIMMSQETACAAIDHLLQGAAGRRVSIGFIGGEPFLNRDVLYSAVRYAVAWAGDARTNVGFSVTTNGTLLNAEDLDFLREHSFAISVSLDGSAEVNNDVRRTRNGASAFDLAVRALTPLLNSPGNTRIAARVTITRRDLRVVERMQPLLTAGFKEVGVSPLRTSPVPGLALIEDDWPILLGEMKRAGEAEWLHLRETGGFRFSNLAIAMKQLHSGHCRALPCGSAASYVSVGARGEYFTCHRTVDDPRFALGSVQDGLSARRREAFLYPRYVDRQEPCRSCWARYLCGGGCHAEVLSAGRSGCDYIRGWLEYCLRFYDRTLREFPTWFQEGVPAP